MAVFCGTCALRFSLPFDEALLRVSLWSEREGDAREETKGQAAVIGVLHATSDTQRGDCLKTAACGSAGGRARTRSGWLGRYRSAPTISLNAYCSTESTK